MDKDYLHKVYKRFYDFIAMCSARELENLILDSRFTSNFNYRMKGIVEDVNKKEGLSPEAFIMFNTKGEIVIIDSDLVGAYIADVYAQKIDKYYKGAALNKVIRNTINSSEKIQQDLLTISYNIIYETLEEIYMGIKYRKEVMDNFKKHFDIEDVKEEDKTLMILSLMIVEDISKYLRIDNVSFKAVVQSSLQKRL